MKQNIYSEYYKKNKDYQMEIYAYSPPGKGMFDFDGHEYFYGEDFRTVKHYKTYQESGLNTILGQVSARIYDEDFESSDAKIVMDIAQELGFKKFILLDDRLRGLSAQEGGVVGEGKKFKTQADLEAYVDACIKTYEHHPMFSSLQLVDEPKHSQMVSVGQVYRAIKSVRPNVSVQCNLNPPMIIFANRLFEPYKGGNVYQKYEAYLNDFLDETGADYFLYDYYPLMSTVETGVHQLYVRGLQVAAEVARKRGVDFRIVIQSMSYNICGNQACRFVSKEDAMWQVNMVLGFGAKQIAYYTYWSKPVGNLKGEYYPDGSGIVTRSGEKTDLYYGVQKANAHIQEIMPVLKDFEYVADANCISLPCISRPAYVFPLVNKELKNVKSFTNDKEVTVISEMYDKANDKYLYRIMNGTDPYYGKDSGEQTIQVNFDKKFTKADVFHDGEWKTIELKGGKYETKLVPGLADYVIIY